MSKRIKIFLILITLPFLIMVLVNELTNVPKKTNKYFPEHCTWYCHNITCLHFKTSYKEEFTPYKKMNKDIFDYYVTTLHGNKLGLNYKNINLVLFIIVYPIVGSLLIWNVIRRVI